MKNQVPESLAAAVVEDKEGAASIVGKNANSQQHHFQTDHLKSNLGSRAISGGLVTGLAQIIRFGLYFVSTIVLSRLLSKEDFGLVAMVAVLTTFLRIFREAGLSTATVQHEGITHAQVSNLFWINVALGVAAALVGAALSPLMAWFYRDPRLVAIGILLSIGFLFSGSAVQHIALLNRQMRFKDIAFVDIGSMALSLIVGVFMALRGWGYWSLVGSQLSASLGEFALAWTFSSWRPQLPTRKAGTRTMLNFGASLTYATILRRITSQMDTILIGRFLGAGPLGLYTRAMALLMRPLDQFVVPFDTVFIPLLSRLQNEPERYRKTFLQVNSAVAMISFPMAGMLLALSRPIVLLLLGPKWEEVVPIFAALALAAMYYPIACIGFWLPTTQGRKRDIVQLGTLISAISVASYAVGIFFGVTGVALAFSLSGLFLRLPIQYQVIGRSAPVSRGDLWNSFFQNLPLWVGVVAAVSVTLMLVPDWRPLPQLVIGGAVGIVTSFVLIWASATQREIALKMLTEARDYGARFLKKRTAK